jgi:hypothetical protein
MRRFKVIAQMVKTFTLEVEAPDASEAMIEADSRSMEQWKERYEDASWEVVDAEDIDDRED